MKKLIALSFIFLSGCMVDEHVNNQSDFNSFIEYDSESLSQTSNEVSGTGRLIADSVFKSTRVNSHILIKGQFLSPDSFLILHLFFDSFENDTGLQIRLKPNEDGESINVEYAEPLRPYRQLTTIKKSLSEDSHFVLRFETRNKMNNDRRILIWNDSLFYDSGVRRQRDGILAGNADYDSRRNNDVFYTWGSGIRWGLTLEKLRLTQVKRETPYVLP